MNQQLRKLVIKTYHVQDIEWSDKVGYNNHTLSLPKRTHADLLDHPHVKSLDVSLIRPGEDRQIYCIMDILPIATKVLGRLGDGITHTMTGVYVMITGADETGESVQNFGSSEGLLSEQLYRGRAGTPGENDLIIHIEVRLKAGSQILRQAVNEGHAQADRYVQLIREMLKQVSPNDYDERHTFVDQVRTGKPKVAIVKMVAAQGTMYDNLLLPREPAGYAGGKSVVDMEGVPVMLSPNEYRDGALRALT